MYNTSVYTGYIAMEWAFLNSLEKCLKIVWLQERVVIKYSLLQCSMVRWFKAQQRV